MCEFKAGDEVVCVNESSFDGTVLPIKTGSVYQVAWVRPALGLKSGFDGKCSRHFGVRLKGFIGPTSVDGCFDSRRFRKVKRNRQDLSIERFLTIKPGFEEPKREPEKQKEKAK